MDEYTQDEKLVSEDFENTPAEEFTPGDAIDPGYAEEDGRIVWYKPMKDKVILVPLTNFTARIVIDTLASDGVDSTRVFTIEVKLGGHSHTFDIPAAEFAVMHWATQHLGADAIIYSGFGIRDHTRAAIQVFSVRERINKRVVYTHLGWREHDERWVYLHAAGAIGESGNINGIDVEVKHQFSRYILPKPPTGKDLIDALTKSMGFLNVAPLSITIPLYAAIWRAVLATGDLSIHLAGLTGQGKSAIAALAQQHFGAAMDARFLPETWESSANVLGV
jgi:hypothetical protein